MSPLELLQALAHLILKRGEARALQRRHERRELLLLIRLDVQPALLHRVDAIERCGDGRLIRRGVRERLAAEGDSLGLLLHGQLSPLLVVTLGRAFQARHLLIAEADPLLGHTPQCPANLLLQLLPLPLGLRFLLLLLLCGTPVRADGGALAQSTLRGGARSHEHQPQCEKER